MTADIPSGIPCAFFGGVFLGVFTGVFAVDLRADFPADFVADFLLVFLADFAGFVLAAAFRAGVFFFVGMVFLGGWNLRVEMAGIADFNRPTKERSYFGL